MTLELATSSRQTRRRRRLHDPCRGADRLPGAGPPRQDRRDVDPSAQQGSRAASRARLLQPPRRLADAAWSRVSCRAGHWAHDSRIHSGHAPPWEVGRTPARTCPASSAARSELVNRFPIAPKGAHSRVRWNRAGASRPLHKPLVGWPNTDQVPTDDHHTNPTGGSSHERIRDQHRDHLREPHP